MTLKDLKSLAKQGKLHGVFEIPDSVYHHPECPGLSNSQLKDFHEDPAKYMRKKQSTSIEDSTKEVFEFGGALHCYVLEQHLFNDKYAIRPDLNLRTNRGKTENQEFIELNAGKIILNSDQFSRIKAMYESVQQNDFARELFKNALFEQAFFWTDPETGLLCKGKTDIVTSYKGKPHIADLKGMKNLTDFGESAFKFGYDKQAAMYINGYSIASNIKQDGFFFIVCGKLKPHPTIIRTIPKTAYEDACHEIRRDLNNFKLCLNNNSWYQSQDYEICKAQKYRMTLNGLY